MSQKLRSASRSPASSWVVAGLLLVSHAMATDSAPPTPELGLSSASDDVVVALQGELERTLTQLQLPNRESPYFAAYWVVDVARVIVSSTLGELTHSDQNTGRFLKVELRVGDHRLDNSNIMARGADMSMADGLLPLPYNAIGAARMAWLASDAAYRSASAMLDLERANRDAQVELQVRPPDFSQQPLTPIEGPETEPLPTRTSLEELARRVSSAFSEAPELDDSGVTITATRYQRRLVAPEGIVSREQTRVVEVHLWCSAQADDGMPLSRQLRWYALEDVDRLVARARTLAVEVAQLRSAPLASDYLGPVLFEGRAAPQLMHEMLATNLSGAKLDEVDYSPLARRLGKRVLPESFTVYDDPTRAAFDGRTLLGHYLMDDEGVAAERVHLIDQGRLRGFLMSRTPTRELAVSNGHGRSGLDGWARGNVGNLFVQAEGGSSPAALRRRLLRAVKDEGAEFGIVVQSLDERQYASGGVAPIEPHRVLKVYLDGREELVRGATLSAITVRDLRGMIAWGDRGWVYDYQVPWPSGLYSPSSVIAPSLLFEELELTKPNQSYSRPKVLPRPAGAAAAHPSSTATQGR